MATLSEDSLYSHFYQQCMSQRLPLHLQTYLSFIYLTLSDIEDYIYLLFGFAVLCYCLFLDFVRFSIELFVFVNVWNLLDNSDKSSLLFLFQVVFPVYCFLLDVALVVLSLFLNLCYLIEIPSFWHIKVSLSPGVSFLIVYSVLEIFPSVPIQIPCGFYYRGFVCVLVTWQGKSFIFFKVTFLVYFQIFNISYVLWNFFFSIKRAL